MKDPTDDWHNDYFDNYTKRVVGSFLGGLFTA